MPNRFILFAWLFSSAAAQAQTGLQVAVLEGDGAINRLRQPVAREPVVRVTDRAGKPVPGAAVNFSLPAVGAGGIFPEGETTLVVTTDSDGRASAQGLRANNVAGQYEIRVTASHRGRTATARLMQVNVEPAASPRLSTKRLVILAAVAGAVAGVALAAKSGGGDNNGQASAFSNSGTVLVPGTPSLGAPR